MAEAHHQHMAASGQVPHGLLDGVGVFTAHIGRHLGRENFIAAVHPQHRHGQATQHLDQGLAHMAAAKQGHGLGMCLGLRLQTRQVAGGDAFKTQHHHAATALAQARAQGIAVLKRHRHGQSRFSRCRPRQSGAGQANGLVLQMPAAHRAHDGAGSHRHPSALLAGARTLDRTHADPDGRRGLQQRDQIRQ